MLWMAAKHYLAGKNLGDLLKPHLSAGEAVHVMDSMLELMPGRRLAVAKARVRLEEAACSEATGFSSTSGSACPSSSSGSVCSNLRAGHSFMWVKQAWRPCSDVECAVEDGDLVVVWMGTLENGWIFVS